MALIDLQGFLSSKLPLLSEENCQPRFEEAHAISPEVEERVADVARRLLGERHVVFLGAQSDVTAKRLEDWKRRYSIVCMPHNLVMSDGIELKVTGVPVEKTEEFMQMLYSGKTTTVDIHIDDVTYCGDAVLTTINHPNETTIDLYFTFVGPLSKMTSL